MADQKAQKKSISKSGVGDKLQSPNTKNKMNKLSINADKTEELLNNSVASSSEQNNEEYHVGDIVWAKIGKYPFWPSIVCIDPDSKTYVKGSPEDKKKFSLHVRFCNDNGRRSWAKILYNYSGKDDLLSKYPNCLSFMKNSKKQMNTWNLAVKEADSWLRFDREERWLKFSKANNIKSPPISPIKSNAPSVATTSNNSQDGDISANSDSTTNNVPDCYIYLKKLSVGQLKEVDLKKRKIIKKNTSKDKKVNPLNNINFACSEKNYQINNDVKILIPAHPNRKVPERILGDVEKLEEEGIRKIREWKASKLAKAASTSATQ